MTKISIPQLEQARINPSRFGVKLRDDGPSSYLSGYPKSLRWLDAVLVYHNTDDLSDAISELENKFSSRKDTTKNRKELENLIIALDNYVNEYKARGYIHLDSKIILKRQLSPFLELSGWIWLINLKPEGGYAGFIISKEVDEINWLLELRFPVIQGFIANNLYGCKSSDVEVGIIDYQTGEHYTTSYSDKDIEEAIEELDGIGNTVSTILSGT